MSVSLDDFDYPLDEGLIAQSPAQRRDSSRLMVLDRASGRLGHHVFSDLPSLLRPDDLLVLNDTAVIPALFLCRRASGGKIGGLFLREQSPARWEVLLKNAARCKIGERLALDDSQRLELLENLGKGRWLVAPDPPCGALEVLSRLGSPPLPPYIHRGEQPPQEDRQRYQTVYAARPGAVAAPTAGLHFTQPLMAELSNKGIGFARVTLHVGMGTFSPVVAPNLAEHKMHEEWYELGEEAAGAINAARAAGRRVLAVGTTSMRVLESAAAKGLPLAAQSGWTNLFLYPPAHFRVADAIITNFHLPRSTLLMLVAAFCRPGGTEGIAMIRDAYAQAAALRYRFYSYGDAMLIE